MWRCVGQIVWREREGEREREERERVGERGGEREEREGGEMGEVRERERRGGGGRKRDY